MKQPPYLKPGDKVAITCPAKKIPGPMTDALQLSWGLEVITGETLTASYHQFAGDDALRTADLQKFLNDDNIKAIFAARGGYGTVRIIDKLDFSHFNENPKWIIGFSDITVLHAHIFNNYAVQSIHGQMPLNIPDASAKSLNTLKNALFGFENDYELTSHPLNRSGYGEGILIGGNLSLLVSISGSVSDLNYEDKILFIEDVGEYLYSIDRLLRTLKRAGKLENLQGLIIGGFTDLKDNDIPFGQTVQEIILEVVKEYTYPLCFDFPAGHISDNRALILGRLFKLDVKDTAVTFTNH
jgi:muramoyltetrapeptide carboxypeptidase